MTRYDPGMASHGPQPAAPRAAPPQVDAGLREAKICPGCGRSAGASSVLCRFCLRTLRDVAVVTVTVPDPRTVRPGRTRAVLRAAAPRTWRRRALLLALLLVALTLYLRCGRTEPPIDPPSSAISALAGPQLWAAAGGDIGATRTTPSDPPLGASVAWRSSLAAPVTAPLVTDGNTLYVALADARLVALSVESGEELWSVAVPGQLDNAPLLAGDAVYAALRGGEVVVLDSASGAQRWSFDSGADLLTGPVVVDGVVWTAARGKLLANDAASGELLGSSGFDADRARGLLVVGAERVVVRTPDRLHFFDRATGRRSFFVRLGSARHVAAGGGAVAAVTDRHLVVYDESEQLPWWDGLRGAWAWADLVGIAPHVPAQPHRWSAATACPPLAPVLGTREVIVTCADGRVRAFELADGRKRWERAGTPLVQAPILTRGGLLLVEPAALVLLDPDSGELIERRQLELAAITHAVVTDGGVYIVSGGELVALR